MAILLAISSYFRASYLTYEILLGGDTGYHIAVSKMTLESLPFTPVYDKILEFAVFDEVFQEYR